MTARAPRRLAGCPTQGGLIIPVSTARHISGRALFGLNHPGRVNDLVLNKRCNICGQPLSNRPGGRYALLLRPADSLRGYSSEPALHPDCARYAIAACPMLNGQQTHYRTVPRDLRAERCGDPACECGIWTNSADQQARAGTPAPLFFLALYRQDGYRPHWGEHRSGRRDVLLGVAVDDTAPVFLERVAGGQPSTLDLVHALIGNLPI